MGIALRYLPVFASAFVLACPQAFCCCLWGSPAAPAPVVACCAKLAARGSPERAPLGEPTPCNPLPRCCGPGMSTLPEKPATQADEAPTALHFALVGDQTLASVIAAASSQTEAVSPARVDPPLHAQLSVWRC